MKTFEAGEATKTDVLQSKVALTEAISQKFQAEGDMQAAEAEFVNLVGSQPPKILVPVDIGDMPIPSSLEEFLQKVAAKNPQINKSKNEWQAARKNVAVAASRIAPQLSASVQHGKSDVPKISSSNTDSTVYMLTLSIPLFKPNDYSGIKSSVYQKERAHNQLVLTKASIQEEAIKAWSSYLVSQAVIRSTKERIEAAAQALEGVQEEEKIGTRTMLDVLNAERDLFSASVRYETAQAEHIVAAYRVHQLMTTIQEVAN